MKTSQLAGAFARMHTTVAAFLLLAVSAFGQAQTTGTVEGRILNLTNGQYIENAQVTIEGTQLATMTDIYGQYRFFSVPVGEVTVDVTFSGLVSQKATVTIVAGATTQHDFSLATAAQTTTSGEVIKLDALVVGAERMTNANEIAIADQRFAPNLKFVMPAAAFGDITEGNLGEFMKFLPSVGIEYNSMDARWIMVQGVSARYTSVTVDGMRMASAASTSPGRFFELEQDSIHNTARAELNISRTPDLPADALGGSVNMVSLSAFEYSKPEFDYNVNLVANSAFLEAGPTPGPEDAAETRKIMPGFDFTYIDPLTKNFGFTIAVLDSNMYNPQYRSAPAFYGNGTNTALTATSPYLTDPYLERYTVQDAPKITIRQAYSADADWRISDTDRLSFAVQENYYDAYVHARGISFDTGTGAMVASPQPFAVTPGDYDNTYTDGLAGKGSIVMYSSDRKKFGRTFNFNTRYKHDGPVWTIDAGFSFSHSSAHYADVANGYPDVISLTMKSVTIDYFGMPATGYVNPTTINVYSNASTPVQLNPYSYANYSITSMTSDPADATDVYRTYKGDIKRDVSIFGARTTLTLGAQMQTEDRDIHTQKNTFTFLPTGTAALAGNYSLMDPDYSRIALPWGLPQVQWASNNAFFQYFQANPQNFSLTQTGTGGSIAYQVNQSPFFIEEIPAVFAMGDTKFMNNRFDLLYGVRAEATHDMIQGGLYDPGAGLSYATGSVQQLMAQYQFRSDIVSTDYSGVYPSVNLSFDVSKYLTLRASYNRAVGRPDLNNIIPGYTTINTTSQTISAPNPALAPEEANNFVFAAQFFPVNGGVFQADYFIKDFNNFWGSLTQPATPQLLNQLGLPQDYLGYQVTTSFNTGTAQVRGIDFNYRQTLNFLPGWASGVSVFADGTALHLQGATNADFSQFISREANWGVTFAQPKYSVQVNWNYRGQEREGLEVFDPSGSGYQYFHARLETDAEASYNITKNISLYITCRNITNQPWDEMQMSPATPRWATLVRREDFGEIWQLGFKGKF